MTRRGFFVMMFAAVLLAGAAHAAIESVAPRAQARASAVIRFTCMSDGTLAIDREAP